MRLPPLNAATIERLLRVAPGAAMLAVLGAAGTLAAQWFWYFAAPSAASAPPAREAIQVAAAAESVASAALFGAAPSGGMALSGLNIRLKGVFAGTPASQSVAIVNAGGRDESARVGGEIVPGVVLESVHARHVVLRRNGVAERLNLEEWPAGAQVAQAAPPRTPAPGAAQPPPAAPPSPSHPGRKFQRPEPYAPVGDVPTEPAQQPTPPAPAPAKPAAPRSDSPSPGVVVGAVPPGSMLERIGLQPGDVIRSVNGEPVATEADVARIVQGRGVQGPFNAEVLRGGTTIPLAVNAGR
jgi:general secretion pathway protein C